MAISPADTDILLVTGELGPELSAAVDLLWAQVPHPRARVHVIRRVDVSVQLDVAWRALHDAAQNSRRGRRPADVGATNGARGVNRIEATSTDPDTAHIHGEPPEHATSQPATIAPPHEHDGGAHAGDAGMDHGGERTGDAGMDHGGHAGMGHGAGGVHAGHAGMGHGAGGDHARHAGMDDGGERAGDAGMDHGGHGMGHGGEHAGHAGMDDGGHGMGHGGEHAGHAGMGHGGGGEHAGHAGMDPSLNDSDGHGGGHHMHHGGVVAGLSMARTAPDRDGLELDSLAFFLGPILAGWPTGLVLRTELQGDVLTSAHLLWVDADQIGGGRPADARSAALDHLSRFLLVAGLPATAREARRARDGLMSSGASDRTAAQRRAEWVARRVRRSRSLAWSVRGVGFLPASDGIAGGDIMDRVLLWCDAAVGGDTGERRATTLEDLEVALTGTELGTARLIVASVELNRVSATVRAGVAHG